LLAERCSIPDHLETAGGFMVFGWRVVYPWHHGWRRMDGNVVRPEYNVEDANIQNKVNT
jgi:hypothetical protein